MVNVPEEPDAGETVTIAVLLLTAENVLVTPLLSETVTG
jgi:hypothetical protein